MKRTVLPDGEERDRKETAQLVAPAFFGHKGVSLMECSA